MLFTTNYVLTLPASSSAHVLFTTKYVLTCLRVALPTYCLVLVKKLTYCLAYGKKDMNCLA